MFADIPEGWGGTRHHEGLGGILRRWVLRGLILFAPVPLAACGVTPERPQLNAAPPAPVVAKVALPVPCAVEQVPMPAYPGDLIRKGDDVYTLARLAMADRRVRIAERDRLRAANNNPCPEVTP
ncbi:hypothetical protein [Sphingomonas desiccabilis]|uniref:Uncharacterized protein n=1 Tax=Sphingomonas desiccabilis TaxID=429134 RepID=A0A4Q2IZL9_9SPHN|nr:hypothetical protein [Sphingomonas desiccabilis]MBB3910128.1 hypothetical protein [Sphingomonas desiccabilis]RXZ34813.1 hypothetical protein EO081_03910 [Sphingomonas desiccabilis]